MSAQVAYERVPDDYEATADSAEAAEEGAGASAANASGDIKLNLCVVGVNGNKTVETNLSWTIRRLKEHAFPDEYAQSKNIRFIFQGKLMMDENLLSHYGLQDQSFIHVSITEMRPQPSPAENIEQNEAENDVRIPVWMMEERQISHNQLGTSGDFLLGFLMGFVLGVLSLIWIWQRNVPRKQRLGIFLGFGCNLMLNTMRVSSEVQRSRNGAASPDTGTTPDDGS